MRYRYLAGLLMGTALLTACGGGSGTPLIPAPTAAPTPTPPPGPATATGTANIGATGGTISVSVANATVKLTVPAGALAGTASVSFVAYATNTASKPFAKRRAGAAGTTFLLGFTVDDGGVQLYAPMQVSLTGPAVASGNVVHLAMYGTKSAAYTDVDTATVSGTTIANQNAATYVGISTASAANPYAFYSIATSAAATPPPLALTATTAATQPLAIQSSATYTGSGADANGNPDAFIPTYALSNATVGTLTPQTSPPYQATLQTGNVSATANLVVTDAVRNVSSNVAINVGSQRPATGGDAYTYAGSWSQMFARVGQPSVTTNATLSETVAVTSGQTFASAPNLYDFHAVDSSVANLATTATTTDTYSGFNLATTPLQFLGYGDIFNDGAGSSVTTTYAAPQLLDQLPEAAAAWTNTGAQTQQETDASGETSTLTYAADGTYTETVNYPESAVIPNSTLTLVENVDGSGTLSLNNFGDAIEITNSAPAAGSIAVNYYFNGGLAYNQAVPAWFATPPPLYTETDVDSGAATLPAGCTTGASIPTSVNKLEQTIDRTDTIIGFTETQVNDTYVAQGYGAVCTSMTDTLNNYYNLQGDNVYSFAWGNTIYQVTTTTQTLALQSATVVGSAAQASARQTAQIRTARAAFEARVRAVRNGIKRDFVQRLINAVKKGNVL